MSNDTNDYSIKSFEVIASKDSGKFGIRVRFERNSKSYWGLLINYHLMCGMLVIVAAINFLIDPKVVPGRAGLLVTIFLVLTNFFSDAQVIKTIIKYVLLSQFQCTKLFFQNEVEGFNALTIYILTCMVFIASALMYYGLILFGMRKIMKIEDSRKLSSKKDIQLSNFVVKCDRLMFVTHVITFILFNTCYFITYFK